MDPFEAYLTGHPNDLAQHVQAWLAETLPDVELTDWQRHVLDWAYRAE